MGDLKLELPHVDVDADGRDIFLLVPNVTAPVELCWEENPVAEGHLPYFLLTMDAGENEAPFTMKVRLTWSAFRALQAQML